LNTILESKNPYKKESMVCGIDTSIYLWLRGLIFCVTWREKKGFSSAPDAGSFAKGNDNTLKRKIVFIRHGESDWNEVFNKEKYLLLPRLFYGLIREFTKCFHGQDSVFLDSPLSLEGCDQADKLRNFLFSEGDPKTNFSVQMAREGTPENSIVIASNLRRAVHTGLIGLYPRLERNNEKILLRAELQEMSRNVDTGSITGKGQVPVVDVVDKRIGKSSSQWLDPSENTGNKKMCTSAKPRFDAFCKYVCDQKKENVIVAAGHSLWFREFFKLYLPKKSKHSAKNDKMLNCASVSFELYQDKNESGKIGYYVKESTIKEDYLGFKKSKKQSKKIMMLRLLVLSFIIGMIAICLQSNIITAAGVCQSGISSLRAGSVIFVVASLGAAGMFTCAGKSPGKLLAVAFYAFLFYLFAVYSPSWFDCNSIPTTVATTVTNVASK